MTAIGRSRIRRDEECCKELVRPMPKALRQIREFLVDLESFGPVYGAFGYSFRVNEQHTWIVVLKLSLSHGYKVYIAYCYIMLTCFITSHLP